MRPLLAQGGHEARRAHRVVDLCGDLVDADGRERAALAVGAVGEQRERVRRLSEERRPPTEVQIRVPEVEGDESSTSSLKGGSCGPEAESALRTPSCSWTSWTR